MRRLLQEVEEEKKKFIASMTRYIRSLGKVAM